MRIGDSLCLADFSANRLKYSEIPQEDLNRHQTWEEDWQMSFGITSPCTVQQCSRVGHVQYGKKKS